MIRLNNFFISYKKFEIITGINASWYVSMFDKFFTLPVDNLHLKSKVCKKCQFAIKFNFCNCKNLIGSPIENVIMHWYFELGSSFFDNFGEYFYINSTEFLKETDQKIWELDMCYFFSF